MTKLLSPLILILFLSVSSFGQIGFEAYWHFGDSLALNFSGTDPVVEMSSVQVGTNVEPASLSEADGSLIAYTDGEQVYNASGDTVTNGVFENTAIENIFCPIPGDEDRFYLFRYSEQSNDVTWTIIDMSDGVGLILDEEKEVVFYDRQCHFMVTSHANQVDRWLVIADNNNGGGNELRFTSFVINSSGFEEVSMFEDTYTFATWYDTLEEARMSPNCTRIATSHKGHYVTLFEFNNETGEVTTGFDNSANLPDSFTNLNYIDFSPSGSYLYVLRDQDEVIRYDADLLDANQFLNSEEPVISGNTSYSHIKRGPDGRMYLLDNSNMMLDVIEEPDENEPTLVEDFLELPGDFARFFPNTVNSCFNQPFALANSVCEGDTTFFNAFLGLEADSLYWVVDGAAIEADTVYDLLFFSELYPSPDIYNVELNYLFDTIWYELPTAFTVFAQPQVELGEDISACQGDEILLSSGENPFNTIWSTGEEGPMITVTITGNYSVSIINGLCNVFDDILVEFTQEPILELDDVVVCNDSSAIQLEASGFHIDDYLWEDGTPIPQLTVDSTDYYSITVSNECFVEEDSALVTYVFFPENLVDSVYTVCADDTLLVESFYQMGSVFWSTGEEGTFIFITDQGDFTVEVEYLGCTYSDEFFVDRLPYVDARELEVPNVVTFNGDKINDVFRPYMPWKPEEDVCLYPTLDVDMKVYNRWGNLLSEGDCRWRGGGQSGDIVPEGVYYYIIDIQSNCLDKSSEDERAGYMEAFD